MRSSVALSIAVALSVGASGLVPGRALADDAAAAAAARTPSATHPSAPRAVAAAAEPSSAFAPPPSLTPIDQPAPSTASALEHRRSAVASGRGMIGYTALTTPKGATELSVRSVIPLPDLFGTLSTGITDTTELSVDLGWLYDGTSAGMVGAGIRQVLARGENAQITVGGAIRRASTFDGEGASMGQVGGTLSTCSDRACRLLLSVGLSALYMPKPTGIDRLLPVLSSGISVGSQTRRFLVEAFVIDRHTGLVAAGARLGSAQHAFDLGVAVAVFDRLPIPLPFAGYSARL